MEGGPYSTMMVLCRASQTPHSLVVSGAICLMPRSARLTTTTATTTTPTTIVCVETRGLQASVVDGVQHCLGRMQ